MKARNLLFLLSLSLPFWAIGQSFQSIYECGKEIVSCETNFENLFINWNSRTITNAEEIQLKSYGYVEMLADSSQVEKYLNAIFADEAFVSEVTINTTTHSTNSEEERFYNATVVCKPLVAIRKVNGIGLDTTQTRYRFDAQLTTQKQNLKVRLFGAKVYIIKLRVGKNYIDNYVFCDPKTNKVIWDNLFKRIKLPCTP